MLKRKYWIITRFNYGLYHTRSDIDAAKWMDDRLVLFENFAARSMHNQIDKDFTWLLLFDEATSGKYIKKVEKLVSGLNVKYEFINSDAFQGKKYGERTSISLELVKKIQEVICKESLTSIQMRFDNDDAYSPETIQIIKNKLAAVRPRMVVEFRYGYIYDMVNNKMYEAEHNNGSPWIAILVNNSTGETVYDSIHQRYNRSEQIMSYRSWMMVVHGNNVSNAVIRQMNPKEVNVQAAIERMGL